MVALSGGVDSAVAAAILQREGYRVTGVTMKRDIGPQEGYALAAASAVACHLGIPLWTLDLGDSFFQEVVLPFCQMYQSGYTPNPCIECNRRIKFGKLLHFALDKGADFLATGHYVRKSESCGKTVLLKGVDTKKDQSYFLYTLGQNELSRILFPLGEMTKKEVLQLACELGLDQFTPGESQDICFIPEGDTGHFVDKVIAGSGGDIIDRRGRIVGKHQGLAHYTVGQRRGLGLGGGSKSYVVRIEGQDNRIIVGGEEELLRQIIITRHLTWIRDSSQASSSTVKLRYRSPSVAVKAFEPLTSDRALVELKTPQRAVAPGQSIVFYQGDEVLGGGIIEAN